MTLPLALSQIVAGLLILVISAVTIIDLPPRSYWRVGTWLAFDLVLLSSGFVSLAISL